MPMQYATFALYSGDKFEDTVEELSLAQEWLHTQHGMMIA